jgi:hypothetical protein
MAKMWQTEQHFVDEYAQLLPAVADGWRHIPVLWREHRTGYGRPDVLLLDARPHVLADRLSRWREAKPMSRYGAYLMVFLLHRRWTSILTVARYLRVTPARAEALIAELEYRELVLRDGRLGTGRQPYRSCWRQLSHDQPHSTTKASSLDSAGSRAPRLMLRSLPSRQFVGTAPPT